MLHWGPWHNPTSHSHLFFFKEQERIQLVKLEEAKRENLDKVSLASHLYLLVFLGLRPYFTFLLVVHPLRCVEFVAPCNGVARALNLFFLIYDHWDSTDVKGRALNISTTNSIHGRYVAMCCLASASLLQYTWGFGP